MDKMPKGWEILKINKIGKVITGKTPPTSKDIYWNGNIPFITPEDIKENKFINKTKRYITMSGATKVGNMLPKNTIVIVCIGSTIGKIGITSKNSISNQQINAILIKNNIDYNYVYYYLFKKSNFLKKYSGTAAVPIIKKSLFEKIELTLPIKIEEQQKIAEILSTVDEGIQKVDEVIRRTERLKKGLMQNLLTKGIGHKEFKDTQLGRVPREWQILRINDIGRVITGKTPPTSKDIYWNGNIPFITPEDIKENKFINKTKRCITMSGATKVGNILPKNTIVVVCIGSTIGKVALTSKNSISNQQINAILIKNNIDYNYIYYYLYKRSDFLKNFSGIAAVPIIKKSLFEKIEIALPNKLKEQQKISEILSTVDKKIELQRKRKEKLERIKKSLMNDLLSGKRRVRIG